MYLYIFTAAGAIFLFLSIIFFIGASKKKKEVQQKTIEQWRQELQQDIQSFITDTEHTKEIYKTKIESLKKEVDVQMTRAQDTKRITDKLIESEHQRASDELKNVKALEEEKLQNHFKEMRRDLDRAYAIASAQFEDEYEQRIMEANSDFETMRDGFNIEILKLTEELREFQAKRDAVNEQILRERQIKEQTDFYRIIIKENDIEDIKVLQSIQFKLFNYEILNKLIFESFIKKPLNEMEKRVIGLNKTGGIYKITYINTGEAYIGRSTDIANRWKEHCLSAFNIGGIAHSTFHNILAEKGLQNFTWEILEVVPKEKQGEREKYWINFYGTQKQFNEKQGG